jgi:hypothetical protein
MEPIFLLEAVDGVNDARNGGIRFLARQGDPSLTAGAAFREAAPKEQRTLRDRFDHWLQGGVRDEYFHGFPNHQQYKHCWVFKLRKGRVGHRWYGFICNPDEARPRFRLCVLVSYATKTERETDTAVLAHVEALRLNQHVQATIRMEFSRSTTRH